MVIPPIVDRPWLAEHPEVVFPDVRWYLDGRSGRAAYERGHLPGAVFVDLDAALAAPASPALGRHPLPAPEVFARELGAAGIGDGDVVVAYDDAGGTVAARLVWMLRVTGRSAALLDGGITADEPGLTAGTEHRPQARPTAVPWPPAALVDADRLASPGVVLLDARDAARYRGDVEPVDPRAGHVPGARSLPARETLGADGRLLPVEELRERFAAAGVTPGGDVVAMCGSGVTACHTLLALEHAGLGGGRLYAGSWSQWSSDPRRPAATGDLP